ncbi:hypothetical protein BU15DRAFT_78916 [Melanogaster broomeanus]|nr:hypothetical protein BU15DRAFT_78916 [Melanogaster broomeanus]
MNTQSTTTSVLPSSKRSQPQKDYSAALADLQSQYGLSGHLPNARDMPCPAPAPLTGTASISKKWYKWGSSRSPSTASLVSTPSTTSRPPTCTTPPENAYEAHLGQPMAERGHGGASRERGPESDARS